MGMYGLPNCRCGTATGWYGGLCNECREERLRLVLLRQGGPEELRRKTTGHMNHEHHDYRMEMSEAQARKMGQREQDDLQDRDVHGRDKPDHGDGAAG